MEERQFHGLSSAEVEERVRMGHTNARTATASKSRSDIVREHSLTYFNFLNLFLGVLVAATGQFKNMTFLGVIIFNTMIGIIQEFRVKKLIDQISVITATKVKVIRDAGEQEIGIDEVVIDDIILVESGMQLCADCRILESRGLEVNESMLTGESKPVRKSIDEELLSGSFVTAGNAVAKVIHVGEENYAASLVKKAKIKKRASSQMQQIIQRIVKIDSILLVPVGILLYLTQSRVSGSVSGAIVKTVAGVIGMIPEGLVLLTSISFVIGVGRLASKKALVQEMEAIEALARVDVLCLDKTGTITTGKLMVSEVISLAEPSTFLPAVIGGNGRTGQDDLADRSDPDDGGGEPPLELILSEMSWAFPDSNATQDALKRKFVRTGQWKLTDIIPFSSDRKYRAAVFEEQGGYVLGAPEFLCPDDEQLLDRVHAYSAKGYRVLLLGSADVDAQKREISGFRSLGLVVIEDQIRTEAMDTFRFFREQNVAIRVLSGDHPATVSQIAVKAGVEGAENYIDARKLPEDMSELQEAVEKYTVFGRVRPEQKQSIIKAIQANGHVAGMVGDGVNDVLALKDADCGIAMAAGSEAAKQVAHIVLLNSDFSCMQEIVGEGRTIISNIEKVSALYLTKTLYSILLSVIFIFWQKQYPFIPIQLSWISGMTIGIPSFLLTLEHNRNKISEGFLKQVLRVSLPASFTMVVVLVLSESLSVFWHQDPRISSMYNLALGGLVSLIVVYRVCRPMNPVRMAMCTGLTAVFFAGLMIAPDFLSVYRLKSTEGLFLIPMGCMVYVLNRGMTGFFDIEEKQNEKTIS